MWALIARDDQETAINIDYCEHKMVVFTNRKSVGERLRAKIGEPTRTDLVNGKIYGVTYERSLYDDDVKKFFSKGLLIGAIRLVDNEEK